MTSGLELAVLFENSGSGPRFPLSSYFWAISFRCPSQQGLGRGNRSDVRQKLAPQNPVLLAKVVNELRLALVHPPGDGDQHEPDGSKTLGILLAY